jgi:hypothetical protein
MGAALLGRALPFVMLASAIYVAAKSVATYGAHGAAAGNREAARSDRTDASHETDASQPSRGPAINHAAAGGAFTPLTQSAT